MVLQNGKSSNSVCNFIEQNKIGGFSNIKQWLYLSFDLTIKQAFHSKFQINTMLVLLGYAFDHIWDKL